MITVEWLPGFKIHELSHEDDFPYFAHPKECRHIEAAGNKLFNLGVMHPIKKQYGSSATHGNLALRIRSAPSRLIVTATDSNKGMLTPRDFVEVCLERQIVYTPEGRLPSTDAGLMINIFLSFRTVFSYAHFHEPVVMGHPIRLTYKNLRGEEWLELYNMLHQGIRAFNLQNHVSEHPPGVLDASIVLGEERKRPFYPALATLKDTWAGKDASII